MELVVISPEGARPDEPEIVAELFRRGLRRYHVRKPGWPEQQARDRMLRLPADVRERCVLHTARGHEGPLRSRSCHTATELRESLGRFESVFLGPVFTSDSKPGRAALDADEMDRVRHVLSTRTHRDTRVLALSGITADRVPLCREWGFDGVAVLGGVWEAEDPVAAFEALLRACRAEPIMCLTQDGLELSHLEQVRLLCAAGAKWIQLRMKGAAEEVWLATAREAVAICRRAGALCIVNDRVDLAVAADADGAHLGAEDGDWAAARRALGPGRLLGGTVNDAAGARRAAAAGCLDYVGVGPLRFTATKARLAPVLGLDGIAALVETLDGLPAWAIGGVTAEDVPGLKAAGVCGVAVTSALYRRGTIAANLRDLQDAWAGARAAAPLSL